MEEMLFEGVFIPIIGDAVTKQYADEFRRGHHEDGDKDIPDRVPAIDDDRHRLDGEKRDADV